MRTAGVMQRAGRGAWFGLLLTVTLAACDTSGGHDTTTDAPSTAPSAAATTTTRAPTTTAAPTTTTTAAPQPRTLDEYLIAVFEVTRDSGVNAASAALLALPTEAAYRDVLRALGTQQRLLNGIEPPAPAGEFHALLLSQTSDLIDLYEALTEAIAQGDTALIEELSVEGIGQIQASLALGVAQQSLVEEVLGERGDPLSRYTLEAMQLAQELAEDIQGVFPRLQEVFAGEENLKLLLEVLDDEAAALERAAESWARLEPPQAAAAYHVAQMHIAGGMAAELRRMLAAVEDEDIEAFQAATRGVAGLNAGVAGIGDLQTDVLLAALRGGGEPTSDGELVWARVPDQSALDGSSIFDMAADDETVVAVGLGARASADGISWFETIDRRELASELSFVTMTAVGGGGPGFVAVGQAGDPDGVVPAVWTSGDGTSWDRVEIDEATFGGDAEQHPRRLATGDRGHVAIGFAGEIDSQDREAVIWFSRDLVRWQRTSLAMTGVSLTDVVAGGPGYVAVGNGIWTSEDGVDWTRRDVGEVSIEAVTVGGPGLVAVGSSAADGGPDAAVWVSEDGLSWSRIDGEQSFGGAGVQIMRDVVAAGAGLVAVGSDGLADDLRAAVWMSPDGLTWTRLDTGDDTFSGSGSTLATSVVALGEDVIIAGADDFRSVVWIGLSSS